MHVQTSPALGCSDMLTKWQRPVRVTLNIDSKAVPLLPDVLELISQGMLTRGDKNNRVYVGETVRIHSGVSGEMQSALFDPQTAGGLLIISACGECRRILD